MVHCYHHDVVFGRSDNKYTWLGLSRGYCSLVSILMSDAVSVGFLNQRVRKNNTVVFIFISNMSSQELLSVKKKIFRRKTWKDFFQLELFCLLSKSITQSLFSFHTTRTFSYFIKLLMKMKDFA